MAGLEILATAVDTHTMINLCRRHNSTVMETLRVLQEQGRRSDVTELMQTMDRTSVVLMRCAKDYGDLQNLHLALVEVVYKSLVKYEKEVQRLHKKGSLARFLTQVRLRSKIDQLSNNILVQAEELETELKDAMFEEGVGEYKHDFQQLLVPVVGNDPLPTYVVPAVAPKLIDDVVQDADTLQRLETFMSVCKDDAKRNELFESITSFQVKPMVDNRTLFTLMPLHDNDEELHYSEHAAGLSVSSYPMSSDPNRPGARDGDPICDQYYGTFFPTRSVVALADGCNWGVEPKEAARKAARMFAAYMMRHQHRIASTKDASVLLLRAFWAAHQVIIDGRTEETMWTAGTTTMIASVVLQLEKPQDRKGYALVLASVGDCKAYCFHQRTRKWDEITKFNRGGVDARDPGGRLGPTLEDTGPDLRNLIMYNYLLEEGDIVVFVSDGVHDNMDPKSIGKVPSDVGLEAEDDAWGNVQDKLLQEQKIMDFTLATIASIAPNPSVKSICELLCQHALKVTEPTRTFMETHSERVPDDYKKYPGKLDHTTTVAFEIGGYASEAFTDYSPSIGTLVPEQPQGIRSQASYAAIILEDDDAKIASAGNFDDVIVRSELDSAASDYDVLPTFGGSNQSDATRATAESSSAAHAHAFAVWSRLFGAETYIVKWDAFIRSLRSALLDGMPAAKSKPSRSSTSLGLDVTFDDREAAVEADLDTFPGGQNLLPDDEDKLRQVVDNSNAGTVTRFRFFEFLGGFGPISKVLDNIRNIISAPWFYGFITSTEAKKFLESHAIGTFLVRFSGTQPGSFVLDYVRDLGHVRSVRLRAASGGGGGLAALTEGSGTKERVFENLHNLVETYTKMNILRVPFTSTLPVKPWFYGDVTRDEAQALLQGQPPGTFLIRFSDRAGCFAASFVHSDGDVKKGLITLHPDGHQVHGKGKVFADLDELVEHYYSQKIFTQPLVSRQEM